MAKPGLGGIQLHGTEWYRAALDVGGNVSGGRYADLDATFMLNIAAL